MLKSFFGNRQWALWAWGGLLLLCALVVVEVRVIVWLNGWYRETWDFLQNPNPLLADAVQNADTDWQQPLAELQAEESAAANDAESDSALADEDLDDSDSNTTADEDTTESAAVAESEKAESKPQTLGALADQQIGHFWEQVLEFCYIVFPFIVLRAFTGFFAQHYAFRWRQAITYAYFPLWGKAGHEIEGASQRLQQDPERFARIVENLGLGFFRSLLTLIAFVPILLTVSQEIAANFEKAAGLSGAPFALPFLSWTANTPASLVLVAAGLALGGTAISFLVGIKLPGLEYNNQRVEARFRKRLVYSEDDKKYADVGSLTELFTGLRFNYFRLFLHYSYFALWATWFAQFVVVADLLLIGTGVVLGVITLGFLNQISHAFSKVTESLAYFVNNWTTVTELMSIVKRLREFERNIGYTGGASVESESVQKI